MKLPEWIAEFDGLDDEEKLEMLVELSDELPPTSNGRTAGSQAESCRVQECQTPVYLWVEVVGGRVRLEADVPKKSPTVRGLVALMVQGLAGASPEEVTAIPDDVVGYLGLQKALGMQRQQGFRGVVTRIKREVRKLADAAN
ncbi:MAG: SufE family protein [Planctomycetes bacterium]|nr:SufE family protein [Planctomycetota bacterium]